MHGDAGDGAKGTGDFDLVVALFLEAVGCGEGDFWVNEGDATFVRGDEVGVLFVEEGGGPREGFVVLEATAFGGFFEGFGGCRARCYAADVQEAFAFDGVSEIRKVVLKFLFRQIKNEC